nr:PEP-CTERM sorting domain-containing protein [Gemmatimonadaceae bacterium]
ARALAALALAAIAIAPSLDAQRLVRRNPGTSLTWGSAGFSNMQGAITTAFGGAANITNVASIANPADLADASALFLDLGALGAGGGMSAAEQAQLLAFIGSGRRVFFLGENNGWPGWNNSLLTLFGGTQGATIQGPISAVGTHPLITGVTTVTTVGAGPVTGGTALFSPAVGVLFGAQQNLFAFFDYNAFANANWATTDNARFGQNVASWLAAPQNVIPEPSTYVLVATGLAALGVVRRRRTGSR